MHDKSSATHAPMDRDPEVTDFKSDEHKADEAWEREKDIVSGVNKTIEKKLGEGDLKPGDIENLGD